MRSDLVIVALGALLSLRCSSFGADNGPSTISDAGASSGSSSGDATSSSSSGGDAAVVDPDGGGDIEVVTPDATPCGGDDAVVLGNSADPGADIDGVVGETIDAYSYVVATHDVARCVHLYVKERGGGGTIEVHLGVYTNGPGVLRPDQLIAQGTITNVTTGWNVVPIEPAFRAPIGKRMWIGILPTSSSLQIAVNAKTACDPSQGGLNPKTVADKKLPTAWGASNEGQIDFGLCDARLYLSR